MDEVCEKPLRIQISKQLLNKVEKIENYISRDLNKNRQLAFLSKIFVIANLPHREPENKQHWIKTNGSISLRLSGGERYQGDELQPVGIPYGTYARLILIWITTQSLIHKTRDIKLRESLSSFMKELGIQPTGGKNGTITAFKEQFIRLCSCKITIESRDVGDDLIGTQFFIVEDKFVKWIKDYKVRDIISHDSDITLSEKFYEIVVSSSVPFDFQIISALKQSPLALDCYLWLTYRTFTLKQPTIISWEQLHEQMGSQYADINNFRMKVIKVLAQIQIIYPALNTEKVRGGLKIFPSESHIKTLKKVA